MFGNDISDTSHGSYAGQGPLEDFCTMQGQPTQVFSGLPGCSLSTSSMTTTAADDVEASLPQEDGRRTKEQDLLQLAADTDGIT